jgi:hypothetical protein
VLGITGVAVAFDQPVTHLETANLLRRCRHAIAVNALTTNQFDSGDRSSAIDTLGFATGNSIEFRPAASKEN